MQLRSTSAVYTSASANDLVDVGIDTTDDLLVVGVAEFEPSQGGVQMLDELLEVARLDAETVVNIAQRAPGVGALTAEGDREELPLHAVQLFHRRVLEERGEFDVAFYSRIEVINQVCDRGLATDSVV